MTAIAILRPVKLILAEPRRVQRTYYRIFWRVVGRPDVTADLHYQLERAQAMAKECGAAEIVVEEAATATAADPAARIADLTQRDIARLRQGEPGQQFRPPRPKAAP